MKNTKGILRAGIILTAFFMTMNTSGQTLEQLHRKGGVLDGVQIRPMDWKSPGIRTVALDPSATLYALKDDTLPLVNLRLIFEGGSSSEGSQHGIKSALAQAMKLGGAAGRSGETIADELAALGATLDIGSSEESFVVSLSCLKADFPAAMRILEDVLLRPDFRPEVLSVIQASMKTGVQRRNDRPESIAQRKLREIMLLPDLRGHSITLEDVDRINLDAVREAHKSLFTRRTLHVALDGDIGEHAGGDPGGHPGGNADGSPGQTASPVSPGVLAPEYEALLRQLVEKMPPANSPYRVFDAERPAHGLTALRGKILLVKKDVSQAVVSVGTFLPQHNHDDFYGLQAGNYILGGGSFVSRLMQEVRAKRGLAYYSYSRNDFEARFGRFVASSGTRSDRAAETLRVMLQVMDGMDGIPPDELKLAVDSIVNSLVFEYDNPGRVLASEIRFRMHHMPPNYLEHFQKRIAHVKPSDVSDVFARNVHTKDLWIVVVGPASLQAELEKLRPVVAVEPEEVPAAQ